LAVRQKLSPGIASSPGDLWQAWRLAFNPTQRDATPSGGGYSVCCRPAVFSSGHIGITET
ncbi:MAG: hypothetical protein LBJ01_03555, partial [Tannerella sp.]|nr:hypothetical protein [Tannerella sp.]